VSIVPLPDSDEEMLIAEDVTDILLSNRLGRGARCSAGGA
jgi:hypothetical protein